MPKSYKIVSIMAHETIDPQMEAAITAQFGELPEFTKNKQSPDLYKYTVADYSPQNGSVAFNLHGDTVEYILHGEEKRVVARRELSFYSGTILYWDGNYQIKYDHGRKKKDDGIPGIHARISYHSNPRRTYNGEGQDLAIYNNMVLRNGPETYISLPYPSDYASKMRFAHMAPGWQIRDPDRFGYVQMFIKNDDPEKMFMRWPHPDKKKYLGGQDIRLGQLIAPKELKPSTFRATESDGLVTFEYMPVDIKALFPFRVNYEEIDDYFEKPKGWENLNQTLPVKLFMAHTPELSTGSLGFLPSPQ